jgi:HPt (histidine-containing phosphotransfer) domain-containing protein
MTDPSLYKLLEQERIAHKTITENLEKKNQELFLINEQLKEANKNLEALVQRRTEEIKSIGLWLYSDITRHKQAHDHSATPVKNEQEKYLARQLEEDELIKLIANWISNENSSKSTGKKSLAEDKPLYDLSKLRVICGGNEQFIQKMVRVFNSESIAAVKQIKEAYLNNDIEKIASTAHRIKPSVQNMGINSLTENILQLESFDITKNGKETLLPLINRLSEVINKVVMQLKENVLR